MTVRPKPSDSLFPVDGEGGHGTPEGATHVSGVGQDDATSPRAPGDEIIEVPEEEVLQKKAPISPSMPTQAEIDQHRIAHLPYRSWCPDCVEAFGREKAHHRREVERLVPLLSCDYAYLTRKGVFMHNELTEEERAGALRFIVAYDSATENPFAHAVPRKGANPEGYVVECLRRDVLWLGHSRVMIRSEPCQSLLFW